MPRCSLIYSCLFPQSSRKHFLWRHSRAHVNLTWLSHQGAVAGPPALTVPGWWSRVWVRWKVCSSGRDLGILAGGMTDVAGQATCGPCECAFFWPRSVCTVLTVLSSVTLRRLPWKPQQEHSREEAARAHGDACESGRHRIDHECKKREKRERTAIWQNVWPHQESKSSNRVLPITLRKIVYNRKLPEWLRKDTLLWRQQQGLILVVMRFKANRFGRLFSILSFSLRKIPGDVLQS